MRKLFFGCLLFLFIFPDLALAEVSSCSVSASPSSANRGSSVDFVISLTNTSSSTLNWIRIDSQSDQMSVQNISTNWSKNFFGDSRVELSGSELAVGATTSFTIPITLSSDLVGFSNSWTVTISDNGGTDQFTCDESNTQYAITDYSLPVISGASLTVGNSSATLTWSTDVATTGTVNYGTSDSYGSSVTSSSGTSHSVTMSSLGASTTYHYSISAVGSGGTTTTTDATFTTSANGVTTTVTNTVTTTTTTTVTKLVTDTTPPVLKITDLEKEVWDSAPLIEGSASDDRGVAKIEYSIDGGVWLGAGMDGSAGDKKTTWEFLPSVSLDGTYEASLRAVDVFGNKSAAKKTKFVIDRLPPTVGGAVFSSSGLVLGAKNGVVKMIEKMPVVATFKELGGAEKVTILVDGKEIAATKDRSTSIWSVEIVLDTKGVKASKIVAVDGAQKKVEKEWVTFDVAPQGKLILDGVETKESEIELWRKNTYGVFNKWDSKKEIGWIVPPGEYYLFAKSGGGRYVSQVLKFEEAGVIAGNWDLGKGRWWSRFLPAGKVFEIYNSGYTGNTVVLDTSLVPNRWFGTNKLIYVTSPDLFYATEGLMLARKEAEVSGMELVVVGVQATKQEMDLWMSGKKENYLDDWEGKWLQNGNLKILPTRYYLDTFGKMVNIKEGVY